MDAQGWARTLLITLSLVATPAVAQTVSLGGRGPVSPDATVGSRIGPVPADAKLGVLAGPLPADVTIGARPGPVRPGTTIGAFAGSVSPDTTTGALLGPVTPDTTSGAPAGALPPSATFREPTLEDMARTQESLARTHLTDGSYRDAEALLRRSISQREEALGAQSPEVAEALESHARLLRRYNRTDTAGEFEGQAQAIREQLKGPVQPR